MFLETCVILFTGGGGVCLFPAYITGHMTRGEYSLEGLPSDGGLSSVGHLSSGGGGEGLP